MKDGSDTECYFMHLETDVFLDDDTKWQQVGGRYKGEH